MTHDHRARPPMLENELAALLACADAALFAEIVGHTLLEDAELLARQDDRFLRWLAEELRDRERRSRATDAAFEARGAEFRARVEARRLRVLRRGAAELTMPSASAAGITDLQSLVATRRESPVPVVELGIAAGIGRELWNEPVERFVCLPREVPDGRYVALRVVGDSMAPLMHSGDTVLVRLGADVGRETVIVARHPDDGYVCKRVSRVLRDRLELASLEPERPLIVVPRQPELIVGTVVLVWCTHREP